MTPRRTSTRKGAATDVNSGRWMAWVVAVGEGCEGDAKFGDIVELSKWAWMPGRWQANPEYFFDGPRGGGDPLVFGDGSGAWLGADRSDVLAFVYPHEILFRYSNADLSTGQLKERWGMHPLADRIIVRLRPRVLPNSAIEIVERGHRFELVGEVEEVGPKVREIAPGDWVLLDQEAGTRIEMEEGADRASVRESGILAFWPQGVGRPGDAATIEMEDRAKRRPADGADSRSGLDFTKINTRSAEFLYNASDPAAIRARALEATGLTHTKEYRAALEEIKDSRGEERYG